MDGWQRSNPGAGRARARRPGNRCRLGPLGKWKARRVSHARAGAPFPEREELGDLAASQWEPGPDGHPRDPWQFARFLYLVDDESAEAFTFTTSSFGGREAITTLADQVERMRVARPGAVPVVALGAAPMQTRFGRKSKPVFRVVRWIGGMMPPTVEAAKALPVRDEMDDEIPFKREG